MASTQHQRLNAVVPSIAGIVIGWLVSAILFMCYLWPGPHLALLVTYAIVAWELRWWPELKFRLPIAIFGGAFLANVFRPSISGFFPIHSIQDLITMPGEFSVVNFSLIGAAVSMLIIFAISPMTIAQTRNDSQHEQAK